MNSSSVEKVGKPVTVTPKKQLTWRHLPLCQALIAAWPAPSTQKSGTQAHYFVKPFSPPSVAPSIAPPVNPFVGPPPTPAKVDPASGSIGQTTRTKMGLELTPDVGETNSVRVVASPPLAEPNVMNVNVVVAECTPWSKTSTVDHLIDHSDF